MPEPKFNYYNDNGSYATLYEQYYFESTNRNKVKPIKKAVKRKRKNNQNLIKKLILNK